jgi:hypothetical protein
MLVVEKKPKPKTTKDKKPKPKTTKEKKPKPPLKRNIKGGAITITQQVSGEIDKLKLDVIQRNNLLIELVNLRTNIPNPTTPRNVDDIGFKKREFLLKSLHVNRELLKYKDYIKLYEDNENKFIIKLKDTIMANITASTRGFISSFRQSRQIHPYTSPIQQPVTREIPITPEILYAKYQEQLNITNNILDRFTTNSQNESQNEKSHQLPPRNMSSLMRSYEFTPTRRR